MGGDDADGLIARKFAVRALRSERQRLAIIGVGAVLLGLAGFVGVLWMPQFVQQAFHGRLQPWAPLLIATLGPGYAFTVRHLLGSLAAQGREPPPWARYAIAFVEISIPSVVLALLFRVVDPLHALSLPPVFLYFLVIALSALRLDPVLTASTGLVAAVQYAALFGVASSTSTVEQVEPMMRAPQNHLGKSVLLLLIGLVTAFVAQTVRRQVLEALRSVLERERVVDMFGTHVSPQVVKHLMEHPEGPVSERRDVCVMFLDIRNFTTFSESRSPEEVVAFLNQLFGFMIDAVNDHGGMINKFLGDGFMAIFGAPVSSGRDCENAVAASMAILARVDAEVAAGRLPGTGVGIGLHAGEAITGHVGSGRRREYTVIGDVVNVASRIEGLNKRFDSRLLVSQRVREALGDALDRAEPLGPIDVKGRADPVQVFRVA